MKEAYKPVQHFGRAPDLDREFHVGGAKEGRLKVWKSGPLWVTQVRGFGSIDLVTVMCDTSNEVCAEAGCIVTIHDWFEVTSSDRPARELMQSLNKVHQAKGYTREIVIGNDSVLLKMSIAAANIVLGGHIETYITPSKFQERFNELRQKYRR